MHNNSKYDKTTNSGMNSSMNVTGKTVQQNILKYLFF